MLASRLLGEISNWIGDAAGVGDGVLAIAATAVNNSKGAWNASLGPKIGSGRNAVVWLGKYLFNIFCFSSVAVLIRCSFRFWPSPFSYPHLTLPPNHEL